MIFCAYVYVCVCVVLHCIRACRTINQILPSAIFDLLVFYFTTQDHLRIIEHVCKYWRSISRDMSVVCVPHRQVYNTKLGRYIDATNVEINPTNPRPHHAWKCISYLDPHNSWIMPKYTPYWIEAIGPSRLSRIKHLDYTAYERMYLHTSNFPNLTSLSYVLRFEFHPDSDIVNAMIIPFVQLKSLTLRLCGGDAHALADPFQFTVPIEQNLSTLTIDTHTTLNVAINTKNWTQTLTSVHITHLHESYTDSYDTGFLRRSGTIDFDGIDESIGLPNIQTLSLYYGTDDREQKQHTKLINACVNLHTFNLKCIDQQTTTPNTMSTYFDVVNIKHKIQHLSIRYLTCEQLESLSKVHFTNFCTIAFISCLTNAIQPRELSLAASQIMRFIQLHLDTLQLVDLSLCIDAPNKLNRKKWDVSKDRTTIESYINRHAS